MTPRYRLQPVVMTRAARSPGATAANPPQGEDDLREEDAIARERSQVLERRQGGTPGEAENDEEEEDDDSDDEGDEGEEEPVAAG